MNLENLESKQASLIGYLENHGYSVSYIEAIQREIRWLLKNRDGHAWESYAQALADRANSSIKREFSNKKTIFTLIARFEECSIFPDRTRHPATFSNMRELASEFNSLAETFEQLESQSGSLKPVTVRKNTRCFKAFLFHLQSRGCEKTGDVAEADVIRFFRTEIGEMLRGYTAKRIISHGLSILAENGFPECERLLSFVPLIKYHHKNVQYLTDDEVEKILSVLRTESGALSLRDRAVGMLLVYTGMRACDIAALKVGDIDWVKGEIHCIQQKTGVPLHLPLIPVVGNAIYDYLENERPEGRCDNVFISTVSKGKLAPGSVGSISSVIYKAAKVRISEGDRKGTHIFRHHLVTAMLSNGVAQPVISQTVGHSSPESLAPYLHADIEDLRKCALDVSRFPIKREEV